MRLLLLWPWYALSRAAVGAYCCGRRMRSVELLCAPIVDDWQTIRSTILGISLVSRGSSW